MTSESTPSTEIQLLVNVLQMLTILDERVKRLEDSYRRLEAKEKT